jgi:hypothetical protein
MKMKSQDVRFPVISIEGTAFECGGKLGALWREDFAGFAASGGIWNGGTPWWRSRLGGELIERHAPHLPDLFKGIAEGAELPEDAIGGR